jgi:hypothetical protein
VQEALELPTVKFLPKGTAGVDHYKGSRIASLLTTRHVFVGQEFSSEVSTYTTVLVSPEGKTDILGKKRRVELYPPDSATPATAHNQVLWTIGRGFSRYIDRITSVTSQPDGLIRITAIGSMSPVNPGKWELAIKPDAAYLVSEASFMPQGRTTPAVKLVNSGLKWVDSACFPDSGTYTFFGLNQALSCDSVKLEANEKLLSTAEQLVRGPHPPNTDIVDNRTSPPLTHHVREGHSVLPPEFIQGLTTTRAAKPVSQPEEKHPATHAKALTPKAASGSPSRLLLPKRYAIALLVLLALAGLILAYWTKRKKAEH